MNETVFVRFYEELNFFLPKEKKKTEFSHEISYGQTVKDMIESEGVPHVEVDLILANGESVGFEYQIRPGDRISVYPMFERLDVSETRKLKGAPLRNPRFILDNHLKKLAWKLRLLGFDVLWDSKWDDPELAEISSDQQRILLTRDRGLLKRKIVTRGLYVHSILPGEQVKEVVSKLSLEKLAKPFSRCAECNGPLYPVAGDGPEASEVSGLVPEEVALHVSEYFRCSDCRKIYWKGSHLPKITKWLGELGITAE